MRGKVPEAQMMADYAIRKLHLPTRNVVLEDQSRSTVENVMNSIPLMADSPAIKIASNTFHTHVVPAKFFAANRPTVRTFGTGARLHSHRVETTSLALVAYEHYRDKRARSADQAMEQASSIDGTDSSNPQHFGLPR